MNRHLGWSGGCVAIALSALALTAGVLTPAAAATPASAAPGCEQPGTTTPVLLVHGFHEGPEAWTSMTAAINKSLGAKNVTIVKFDYHEKNTEWVTNQYIGAALATEITCLAAASAQHGGPGKVVIVAHSMGGLAVRCAIDQACVKTGNPAAKAAKASQIGLDITLGTPNLGSDLATAGDVLSDLGTLNCRVVPGFNWPLGCPDLLSWLFGANSPAAKALEMNSKGQPSGQLQNLPEVSAEKIPLYAMAGKVTVTTSLFDLPPFPLIPFPGSPSSNLGDLVVSVESALAGAPPSTPQGSGSTTHDCGTVPIYSYIGPAVPRVACWHLSETTDPAWQDQVVIQIKKYQASQVTAPKDWYNTSYTSTCGGNAPHQFTVNVQNGEGTAPGSPQYYDVRVEAVKHGDLTGDGGPDTAVLLYCTPQPSNFYVQDVQVFGPDNSLLAELPHVGTLTPTGSPLPPQYVPSELSISSGQLIAGMKFYAPTDSHASGPSLHRTLTWKWNGSQFVLVGGGVSNVSPTAPAQAPAPAPTADVLALLQKSAMQHCQSGSYASECTPGGAKVSKIDPRYGIGIADATGGHGTIYMRPSASSTAFTPVMNLGGDIPTCSQVQAAEVPSAVFEELLGQPCQNI